ncbi:MULTISPECIES: DUF397 domain-containing protein [unclassified Streptomyces]|uniref:DUF397 domain-containing protein n=1 Tax=unclassified Streptomyces TaxID=2593676 RepID=UPI001B38B810|nr:MULTISPECIES: DUF397 domain-containing protein [unclassified Streptomyces]MBQ0879662.1 DUF397 domain-containing protein [Streptomyces sp. RT42]
MSTTELAWFKSSYIGSSGDNCVEVAVRTEAIVVRDSKDTDRQELAVSRDAWSVFTMLVADSRV